MRNELVKPNTFEKLYRKKCKKSPKFIVQKVDNAIRELADSPQPELLGEPKKGPLGGTYAYELGRKNRILYKVDRTTPQVQVILLKVCSHADAYGK